MIVSSDSSPHTLTEPSVWSRNAPNLVTFSATNPKMAENLRDYVFRHSRISNFLTSNKVFGMFSPVNVWGDAGDVQVSSTILILEFCRVYNKYNWMKELW